MTPKRQNVRNLDIESLDGGGTERSSRVRRIIEKRFRELQLKGFGLSLRFNQRDERGSEEE